MKKRLVELRQEVVVRAMRRLPMNGPRATTAQPEEQLCGHCFRVRVTLRGAMDPLSGLVFERDRLERILRLSVIEPMDGAILNEKFPNVSNEGLARALFLRLQPLFPEKMLTSVSIFESDSIWAEYPA